MTHTTSASGAGSSFVGNSGPSGGAIALVRSAMNVTNTMFHRNTAQGATQAGTQRGHGGAVWSRASVATVHDCTFSENYADGCVATSFPTIGNCMLNYGYLAC